MANTVLSAQYRYKRNSASSYGDWVSLALPTAADGNFSASDIAIAGDLGASGFNLDNAYSIQVQITDRLYAAVYTMSLKAGKPIVALNKEGIALGKPFTTPGIIDSAWTLGISGGGTGAGTAAAALANLGLPVASGTWTPKLISSDGGMTYTTSYNYSYYYRIGKLVYITFYMKVNVTAVGSGYARVQGLPFAPMGSGRYGLARMQFARTTSDTVGGAVAHVDSSLGMIRLQSENGLAALTWKEGDTWIGFAGCYIMDE